MLRLRFIHQTPQRALGNGQWVAGSGHQGAGSGLWHLTIILHILTGQGNCWCDGNAWQIAGKQFGLNYVGDF